MKKQGLSFLISYLLTVFLVSYLSSRYVASLVDSASSFLDGYLGLSSPTEYSSKTPSTKSPNIYLISLMILLAAAGLGFAIYFSMNRRFIAPISLSPQPEPTPSLAPTPSEPKPSPLGKKQETVSPPVHLPLQLFSINQMLPSWRGCNGRISARQEGRYPDNVYAFYGYGSSQPIERWGTFTSWGPIFFQVDDQFLETTYEKTSSTGSKNVTLAWQVPGYNVTLEYSSSSLGYESSGGYGTLSFVSVDDHASQVFSKKVKIQQGC